MPKAPEKRPDRHYNFRMTNVVFAWTSFALLAVTIWMVAADYAKPWKRLQAKFRQLEHESVMEKVETEQQKLDAARVSEAEAAIASAEARLSERSGEIEELESRFVDLDKKIYALDAEVRGVKSLLDTARYELDAALQRGGDAAEEQADVDRLASEWTEGRKSLELLIENRDEVADELAEQRAERSEAEQQLAALRGDLDAALKQADTLEKSVDYFALNAPLMDFVAPDLKVEQVMLPGLYQNINFTNVDRVDRCVTCHVASARVGFDGEEWEHPFRSHPRLDLFVGAGSPHPYSQFGCSACHGGLDRATDFARAGHSPESEEEKKEWKKEWGWEKQKYLDTPILPAKYSEAGCVTCHAAGVWTGQTETQDTGRELISRMGCFGCHLIDYPAYQDMPRPGPSLRKVAGKTNPGWAYEWIKAPREFHPSTWMPHFFFQSNTQSPENLARQNAEIVALVSFLWSASETDSYPEPPTGDPGRGQELFESVGCTGCHILDADATRDDYFPQINRLHGPNLIRTGSKVSPGWLYAWIKDPKQYFPETRMPSLRLTDSEAADIVAYLMDSRDPAFENLEVPGFDAGARDELVLYYLQNTQTIEGSEATLSTMSDEERNVYLGEQTAAKYGCYACHDVAGFEDAKPIGVELTEEGSKPVHQFDFGHVHDVPHTRHDWIQTKLLDPRIWDEGKEPIKSYNELYKMPNFGMSEREADAVLTNVLGFTKESVRAAKLAAQSAEGAMVAEGRKLITRYNCRGCHLIEDEGHAIKTSIEDAGMLPPNLAAIGARVQSDWLFGYLHDPASETMRPWLNARMPSFGFSDEEVNGIVGYFTARDARQPFLSAPTQPARESIVVGEVAFEMLQCAKCHPSGPAASSSVASAGELAPSLLLAPERLRHDWVPSWILDPQSWVRGTNMPANFPQAGDGTFSSPLARAIDTPLFASQKARARSAFSSEEEMNAFLADPEKVTEALRDHIWWTLN